MSTTPEVPERPEPDQLDDDELFDALARRAGEALRRPAPDDGLTAIVGRQRRRKTIKVGVVGGVAVVALIGAIVAVSTPNEPDRVVPADTSPPDTVSVEETTPPTSAPPTQSGATPFEPTNVPTEEQWLVPPVVPEGFEFAYAEQSSGDDRIGQSVVYYYGADLGSVLDLVVSSHFSPDGAGVDAPAVPSTVPVDVNGDTWWWESRFPGRDAGLGTLWGTIGDRAVVISGVDRDVATQLAGTLEMLPAGQLPRPPFSDDPATGLIVATLSGAATTVDRPDLNDLRAATDGLWISLGGGEPRRFSPVEPVSFGVAGYPPPAAGADTALFVVWGHTLPAVASLEFEQLDGAVVTVEPRDLSGHFGIGFFLVAIEAPIDAWDAYPSLIPSVVARDASGAVVARISEPI